MYEIYNYRTGEPLGRTFPTRYHARGFILQLQSQTEIQLYWKVRRVSGSHYVSGPQRLT